MAISVKIITSLLLLCFSGQSANAQSEDSPREEILVSSSILENSGLPFYSHRGNGRFDTALAMNVDYGPLLSVRAQLNELLDFQLKFFVGWDPEGEAHVTTITPVEYYDVLKPHLSIERIEKIALENNIQGSDLKIIGVGSGSKEIENSQESAYFIIVESQNLNTIRRKIHEEFIRGGGDPDNFYPHITIGYTLRDLHESDGILKDAENSLDERFTIKLVD